MSLQASLVGGSIWKALKHCIESLVIYSRFELNVEDVVKALQWKTDTVLVEKSTKLNNLVSLLKL